jgi:hypothetical protein
MCEFSSKLIAWLDNELPENDAATMEHHLSACRECREQADTFLEVSNAFAVCARAVTPRAAHSHRRWLLVPAAVAAAVFAVFLLWPRRLPNVPPDAHYRAQATPLATVAVPRKAAVAVSPGRHRRVFRRAQRQASAWQPAEPTVQVIIPADALFPPGALPEGISFVADLRLAADGAPGGLALRP